jgi:L-ascorbate metabolism protein UlaG (beta-lactamase superfamily)
VSQNGHVVQRTVTWVGHATLLAEMGDVRVLTDPVLGRRLGHLRRRTAAPADDVRRADVVLVSHAHADHMDRRSLREVATRSPGATLVVPRGAARFVGRVRFPRVLEVTPGDSHVFGDVAVEVVHAEHSPHRGRVDRRSAPAVGYVISYGGRRLYFAGDTDLFDGLAALGPVDLAALPISGWWKKLGPGHLDEARAAVAVERLAAARVLPIHWGTFSPEDLLGGLPRWLPETGRRFERELAARGLLDRLVRLEPGQTARW